MRRLLRRRNRAAHSPRPAPHVRVPKNHQVAIQVAQLIHPRDTRRQSRSRISRNSAGAMPVDLIVPTGSGWPPSLGKHHIYEALPGGSSCLPAFAHSRESVPGSRWNLPAGIPYQREFAIQRSTPQNARMEYQPRRSHQTWKPRQGTLLTLNTEHLFMTTSAIYDLAGGELWACSAASFSSATFTLVPTTPVVSKPELLANAQMRPLPFLPSTSDRTAVSLQWCCRPDGVTPVGRIRTARRPPKGAVAFSHPATVTDATAAADRLGDRPRLDPRPARRERSRPDPRRRSQSSTP